MSSGRPSDRGWSAQWSVDVVLPQVRSERVVSPEGSGLDVYSYVGLWFDVGLRCDV